VPQQKSHESLATFSNHASPLLRVDFIDNHASTFQDTLELRYPQGQKPQLVLFDDDEQELEVLSITSWNVDSISDYLKENVKQSP
jgi:hypothetical protein